MPKRRKRITARDPITGKRIRFYADTMQRYAHQPDLKDMAKTKDPSVLIVDVATSGFRDDSLIMEVSCMLLDCRPPYDVLETFSGVVKHEPGTLDGAPDFHAPLVQECYHSEDATRLPGKEGFLLAGPWSSAGAVLNHDCGFTLKFLAKYMPLFFKSLPKCVIDLKGVDLLLRSKGVPAYVPPAGGRSYRAADDVILAYEELVHLLTAEPVPVSTVVRS
jgi:hypothetical protein